MRTIDSSTLGNTFSRNPSAANASVDFFTPRQEAGKTLREGFLRFGFDTTSHLIGRGVPQELLHGVTSWMAALDPVRRECIEKLDQLHNKMLSQEEFHRTDFESARTLLKHVKERWSASVCVRESDGDALGQIRDKFEASVRRVDCLCSLSMACELMKQVIAWPPEPGDVEEVADYLRKVEQDLRDQQTPADHAQIKRLLVEMGQQFGALGITDMAKPEVNFAVSSIKDWQRNVLDLPPTKEKMAENAAYAASTLETCVMNIELNRVLSAALCFTVAAAGGGATSDPTPVGRQVNELISRWVVPRTIRAEPGSAWNAPHTIAAELKGLVNDLPESDSPCHIGVGLILAARRAHQSPYFYAISPEGVQRSIDHTLKELQGVAFDPPRGQTVKTQFLKDMCWLIAELPLAEERRMLPHLVEIAPTIFAAADVEELNSIGKRLVKEVILHWGAPTGVPDNQHS